MLTQNSHNSVSAQRESNSSAAFFLSVADALVLERSWVITVLKVVCIHSSWVVQNCIMIRGLYAVSTPFYTQRGSLLE